MSPPAVKATGVGFDYPGRRALDEVSFAVERGEIFAFLGPNGSGKSTLFRILATLVPVSEGRVDVLGHELPEALDRVRRRLGVVFQAPGLDPLLSVEENLRHHGRLFGLAGARLARRVTAELERFALAARRRDRVATLSGGLARRAELAKVLVSEPELLLLDEPSTGLDPAARRDFRLALRSLCDERGTTVLLTTHFMEEAEACDRIALLDEGRVVALGRPRDLVAEIGGEVVVIRVDDPEDLQRRVAERLGVVGSVVDGLLRFEQPDGHRLVTRLAETFPGVLEEVRLTRPSLEDVFLRRTGHRFDEGGS